MKEKKQKIIIVILVVVAILICSIITALLIIPKNFKKEVKNNEEEKVVNWSTEEELEKQELEKLKNMTEKQRMQRYLAKYLSYIEDKEYEKAYKLLNDNFKNRYFPTLDKFEEYVKTVYTSSILVTYDDIQRQAKYFILKVTITMYENEETKNINQNFIVYEKDYNDFEMSFSVK